MLKNLHQIFMLLLIAITSFSIGISFLLLQKLKETQNNLSQITENVQQPDEMKSKVAQQNSDSTDNTEYQQMLNVQQDPISKNDLLVAGWIPDWDIPEGFASLQSSSTLKSISPVWFWINEDGTLQETAHTNDEAFMSYCENNAVTLIPTITLFDPAIMQSVLNNPEAFNTHVNEILHNVELYDYDGIDLDYESIYLKDKEKYFDLIERLSEELHSRNKLFVVTVLPKWGDEVVYKSLPETRMVQDYKRIADLVDEFRIMTYEYTGRDSELYGPIAPLAWMEDTIRYAVLQGVSRDKIMLGIHTYSYNYTAREKMNDIDYYPVFGPKGTENLEPALAHFPDDIIEVLAENSVTVQYDSVWQEAIGTYYSENTATNRILVFPTQSSIDARMDLAASYGLKGIIYWRVGREGDLQL